MSKYILIPFLAISICGCMTPSVLLTAGGIATTGLAAVYKYQGDKKKLKAINKFRNETRKDLADIKEFMKK